MGEWIRVLGTVFALGLLAYWALAALRENFGSLQRLESLKRFIPVLGLAGAARAITLLFLWMARSYQTPNGVGFFDAQALWLPGSGMPAGFSPGWGMLFSTTCFLLAACALYALGQRMGLESSASLWAVMMLSASPQALWLCLPRLDAAAMLFAIVSYERAVARRLPASVLFILVATLIDPRMGWLIPVLLLEWGKAGFKEAGWRLIAYLLAIPLMLLGAGKMAGPALWQPNVPLTPHQWLYGLIPALVRLAIGAFTALVLAGRLRPSLTALLVLYAVMPWLGGGWLALAVPALPLALAHIPSEPERGAALGAGIVCLGLYGTFWAFWPPAL